MPSLLIIWSEKWRLKTKMTSKEETTIPKEIRGKIGLEPWKEVYFEEKEV